MGFLSHLVLTQPLFRKTYSEANILSLSYQPDSGLICQSETHWVKGVLPTAQQPSSTRQHQPSPRVNMTDAFCCHLLLSVLLLVLTTVLSLGERSPRHPPPILTSFAARHISTILGSPQGCAGSSPLEFVVVQPLCPSTAAASWHQGVLSDVAGWSQQGSWGKKQSAEGRESSVAKLLLESGGCEQHCLSTRAHLSSLL